MELKNYSVFHIGIKTKASVNLDEFRPLLKDFAISQKYSLSTSENLNFNEIFSKGLNVGIEKIAEKDETNIHFNLNVGAINFAGKDPEKVSELFKEALIFLENKGYELKTMVKFFEIFAEINFENGDPSEVLKGKMNLNAEKLSPLGEAEIDTLKIKTKGSVDNEENYLEVTMGLNPLKPSKAFIIKIVKRTMEKDVTYNFYKLIKSSLEDLINN